MVTYYVVKIAELVQRTSSEDKKMRAARDKTYGPSGVPVRPITMHSSLARLPSPKFPEAGHRKPAQALQRQLMIESGIDADVYSVFSDELVAGVVAVYEGLHYDLTNKLAQVEAFDLCVRLYERVEQVYGHIEKLRFFQAYGLAPGNLGTFAKKIDDTWERVSLFTEPIRWLIEMAVKYGSQGGHKAGHGELERLIAHAQAIFEWDLAWEHIYHGGVPHELTVHDDYSVTVELTPVGHAAVDKYRRAISPYTVETQRRWSDLNTGQPETFSFDELTELQFVKDLNGPLEEERGYSMEDWMRFSFGIVDSFDYEEYRKIISKADLGIFLQASPWGLPSERFERLLDDFAVSKAMLADVEAGNFRPVEYARRASRLLRRPVVLLEVGNRPTCLYGIEMAIAGGKLLLQRLETGRIKMPGMRDGGPVSSAIRRTQSTLGDSFRDLIAEDCRSEGFFVTKEKGRIKGSRIPQASGFGPVDIFVVDPNHRRFVLVEAKDDADEGTVPQLMGREFRDFQTVVNKVRLQVAWFEERVQDLKSEFHINADADYSVQGVVVVNYPRLWMYSANEPIPVVDVERFAVLLREGRELLTYPVTTRVT